MSTDLAALLQPLHPDAPCGEDLAFSGSFDAIARAREHDDPALAQGAWVAPLKLADWPAVARITQELLLTRSKDLRLAAWWAEAQASLRGWRGLADGLELAAALVRQHWEQLHPGAGGADPELRIGALAWLLKRGTALASDIARADETRDPAATDWPGLLAGQQAARAALAALEQAVDARLGADGPAFRPARDALDHAAHTLKRGAQAAGWQERADTAAAAGTSDARDAADAAGASTAAGAARPAKPQPAAGAASGGLPHAAVPTAPAPGAATPPAHGPIRDRDDAVQRLREIAAWFRRAEPHSPAGYLADKAADWAGLPLHDWLRLVLKGGGDGPHGGALSHVEGLLGIGAISARPVD